MLIIQLTPDQIGALAGARDQIGRMADAGKPGAICAQVYGDHMRVGIMSNEAMQKMYEAMGTPEEKRAAHRTAYDLAADKRSAFDTLPDDFETGDH